MFEFLSSRYLLLIGTLPLESGSTISQHSPHVGHRVGTRQRSTREGMKRDALSPSLAIHFWRSGRCKQTTPKTPQCCCNIQPIHFRSLYAYWKTAFDYKHESLGIRLTPLQWQQAHVVGSMEEQCSQYLLCTLNALNDETNQQEYRYGALLRYNCKDNKDKRARWNAFETGPDRNVNR